MHHKQIYQKRTEHRTSEKQFLYCYTGFFTYLAGTKLSLEILHYAELDKQLPKQISQYTLPKAN